MKVHYLGTCSGTEPMKGMHHCSLVIECGGTYYWFDAGECCVHTAYTAGMDVTRTKCLFISHPHVDHVGGLANFLACLRKLVGRYKKRLPCNNTLKVFIPDLELFDAIKRVACSGEGCGVKFNYNIEEMGISDGVLYEDDIIKVSASHNRHLREDGSSGFHSFSFLIEAEGKRVVFSGDVLEPCELDSISDGADLLIMETGHHSVKDVCAYAKAHSVSRLRFNHHGREILDDRETAENCVSAFSLESGIDACLCYDGMVEEI